jgi:hypothetical protein
VAAQDPFQLVARGETFDIAITIVAKARKHLYY